MGVGRQEVVMFLLDACEFEDLHVFTKKKVYLIA